jgi:hypothetical protein
LYIIISSRPDVVKNLETSTDTAIQVVLEICLNEMTQQKWTEAKVKFVVDILKKHGSCINLFGSEFEMAVKHLVKPQEHITEIYCIDCMQSRSTKHDLIELGLGRQNVNSIHDLVFDWEQGVSYSCPARCDGSTTSYHHFPSFPVLMFIAVDLASASGRLKTETLSEPIMILSQRYDLYAATLNAHGHFKMLVRSHIDGPWYNYDGLRQQNRFKRMSTFKCDQNTTVVHLIYVKHHI